MQNSSQEVEEREKLKILHGKMAKKAQCVFLYLQKVFIDIIRVRTVGNISRVRLPGRDSKRTHALPFGGRADATRERECNRE